MNLESEIVVNICRSIALVMRHDWKIVLIRLGDNIRAAILRTQAYDALVQIHRGSASINAEMVTLKSREKTSVVSAWPRV